ncbi:MAG TPA: SGNH/GDSL hydrolase family protein [Candidatus Nanoarchaeia archaeon]|nr:SGNH/GDSL hydrolase family protein [Candidatus Nanoarchaeia archaeon]
MTQILVFGDSISYGAWDIEGGWVQRLRRYLDKITIKSDNKYYIIYNLGVSGDTTKNLLERFEFETKQRLNDKDKNEEVIFIFAIGGNDCFYINAKKNFLVKKEEFIKNIKKLIKLSKSMSSKIVFVGLNPTDEIRSAKLPWHKGISYKNENIKEYNSRINNICKENKVNFIDIYDKLIKVNYKSLMEDGSHPNTKGHKLMFEIIKDYLVKNKIL